MKKLLLFLMLALSLGIPGVQAGPSTSTLTLISRSSFTSGTTSRKANDGATWIVTTKSGAIQGWQSNSPWVACQFGSKNAAWTGNFSTADITGTITEVVVECGTGGSANISMTVGGKSFGTQQSVSSGSVAKYTFKGNELLSTGDIVLTVSGTNKAFYLRSIAVTYTAGSGEGDVTLEAPKFKYGDGTLISEDGITVEKGTVIEAVCSTAGATVKIESEPEDAVGYPTGINGATVTVNKSCTLTATSSLSGAADKTTTLVVTVKEGGTPGPKPSGSVYRLITSVDELVDGMTFVIASNTEGVLMGKTNSGSFFEKVGFTFPTSGNEIEVDNESVNILTLVSTGVSGVWNIKTSDGKYLYWNSGNSLNVGATKSGNTYDATISFLSNNAKIAFKGQTSQYIQYNSDSPRFACYSSNQKKVQIYGITTPSVATPTFVVADNATFETGSDGTVYYTNPTTVTIATTTPGASVHYTIGDSTDETVTETNTVTLPIQELTKITAYATYPDYNDSKKVSAEYHFRTATPVVKCDDATDAQIKTVTASCVTEGATIEYSTDGGTTWTAYSADGIVFNESGKTVNIMVRATSELGESETVEYHVSIYPMLKWQPFELVTDITKLVPGDEVIFVSARYNYAMKPYEGNDNNCKAEEITKTGEGTAMTVKLDPSSESVGIYTVEKTADGKYKFKGKFTEEYREGTFTEGYLAAVVGEENRLHCHTDEYMSTSDKVHATEASVVINPKTGVATVTFEGEGLTHNVMRYSNAGGNYLFSCYVDDKTGYDINIYRRGEAATYAPRPTATPHEGVYEKGELTEVTLQCLVENNVVTDPSLKIYYTIDGSNPRKGGLLYTGPIKVDGNITVRAYATMDGYFDSPSLIASYDIFEAGKEYRRVTKAEMRHLKADDDIIVLGSPSDEDAVYAMSRAQSGEDNTAYREAIQLDNVVKSDGRIVINKKDVQILTLLEGDDYYGGYDWRLYAAGSSIGADKNSDGFLLAEGNYNALKTIRIDTPASDRLPNADVRFHCFADGKYGNEYGGVTVQFGSPDNHELDYPKLMALTRTANDYRFDVRKEGDFTASDPSSWYVSIFKVFDPTMLYAPSFTILDSRVTPETDIEITSPNKEDNPDTEIWYSMDGGSSWTKYTAPFNITDMGTYTVLARTRNANLSGGDAEGYSDIVEQTYIVTDNEIFELVTDASTLRENDRIVFVNAIKFPYGGEESTGWYTATTFDSVSKHCYFNADDIEPVNPNEEIPTQFIVPSESNIQVFRLEYDTSAKNAARPWLLYANGHKKYLCSKEARFFELKDLPENIDERQYMNVGFEIGTSIDFGSYGNTNNNYWTNDKIKTDVIDNAIVTFTGLGNITNYLRFNPNNEVFRGYDNGGRGTPSPTTWPVRVYRATKRVLPPTVTVYDATTENGEAYETAIETFNNAVKVVIRQNPKTDKDVDLLYSWSKTVENAPVLSEYLNAMPKDANEIELLVDGSKILINVNGEYTDIDGLATIEDLHVLRAVASDGINTSPSLPRTIAFKCAKPIVGKGAENTVKVGRPGTYTIGAQLYYSYDDELVVMDESRRVDYVKGTTELMEIPFGDHKKVNVVAFKDGYEPSDVAVYTPYTFIPRAHAVQLLELTDEGKAKFAELLGDDAKDFIGEDKCYVTYRTVETGQFYLVKENGNELEMTPCTDNVAARDLIDYRPANANEARVNVKWTTDYYVHVVDEAELVAAVGGAETLGNGDAIVDEAEIKATIYVNGSKEGIATKRSAFSLNGEEKMYRGALLKRGGAIGTIILDSTVEYTVNTENGQEVYTENGTDQITPLIPSVYGGHYAYVHSQEAQDMTAVYGTDFLKFKVESRVKTNSDGTPAVNEVLIPTRDLDPRHLDAVITFFRPNVSDEILDRNDIYYTITMSGEGCDVDGSGLYVDRQQAQNGAEAAEFYRFTVKNVSPREVVYPTLTVEVTEYVENQTDGENYGRFTSNYGDNLTVEAANYPALGQGTISKVHLGKLEPGKSDGRGNANTTADKYMWMYKGHNGLVAPEEKVHDNADVTEDAVMLAPVFYLVETYSTGKTDYASYEYLVKHTDGHNNSNTGALEFAPDGTFITDDVTDPLLGTYLATEFASNTDLCMAMTPVYIFSHEPAGEAEATGSSVVAPLEKMQSHEASVMAAKLLAPARAASGETNVGSGKTAPSLDEVRPMRHYGHTDMTAANITDLTGANAPFDVVAGKPIVRQLEDGEVTGVEDVVVDEQGDVEYYNLQGVRVMNPSRGVYIERRGNKAVKVVID